MKSATSLLILIAFVLFLFRPGEERHHSEVIAHILLRSDEGEQGVTDRITKQLRYNDYFLFSTTKLDDVLISHGVLGRVTILQHERQRAVLLPEPPHETTPDTDHHDIFSFTF